MTTCNATAFGTLRSFADGDSIKSLRDCTYAQLEVVPPHELAQIFGLAGGLSGRSAADQEVRPTPERLSE